jgi:hypothetical protein
VSIYVPFAIAQVACQPPGGIVVKLLAFQDVNGSFLQLALEQVAGSGAIRSVELRQTPVAVRRVDGMASSMKHEGMRLLQFGRTNGAPWTVFTGLGPIPAWLCGAAGVILAEPSPLMGAPSCGCHPLP